MAKSKAANNARVLFIGNSFTQRNDLPGLITGLAAEQGLTIRHELISAGGASLRTHWNAGKAAAQITSGRYDYVVLQEQSTLPVKNARRMAENIGLFDEVIRQAGSQTVLYMTWARQHSPAQQPLIAAAYESIAKSIDAAVAPVGTVWQNFIARHERPTLYDTDQSHPSLAGSYLAACVFVASLLSLNLAGSQFSPPGLAPADATCIANFVGQDTANCVIGAPRAIRAR